jgi:hypothetical protein
MTLISALSTLLAIPALWLAIYFGVMFFQKRSEKYGALNDIFSAITLLLLVLPALILNNLIGYQVGGWFSLITWLAVAGILIASMGQFLLVAKIISLQASFITGSLGFIPLLVWLVSIAVVSIGHGAIPLTIGWSDIAILCSLPLLAFVFKWKRRMLKIAGVVTFLGATTLWLLFFAVYLMGS